MTNLREETRDSCCQRRLRLSLNLVQLEIEIRFYFKDETAVRTIEIKMPM